jgi:hypothetical protein
MHPVCITTTRKILAQLLPNARFVFVRAVESRTSAAQITICIDANILEVDVLVVDVNAEYIMTTM